MDFLGSMDRKHPFNIPYLFPNLFPNLIFNMRSTYTQRPNEVPLGDFNYNIKHENVDKVNGNPSAGI